MCEQFGLSRPEPVEGLIIYEFVFAQLVSGRFLRKVRAEQSLLELCLAEQKSLNVLLKKSHFTTISQFIEIWINSF